MDFRISSIEELRYALSLKNTSNISKKDIQSLFGDIAKFLIEKCIIVAADGRKYGFQNIEFYFYSKTHRDIITHPRISDALQWYINDFGGIDLNFESTYEESETYFKNFSKKKPILNDKCCFGGILIRELRQISGDHLTLIGPLACAELFRICDAENGQCKFPKLVEEESSLSLSLDKEKRKNILRSNQDASKKVEYILSEYENVDKDEADKLLSEFNGYKDERYCYKSNN